MAEKEIKERIQEYRAQILETLSELIAIPTVNPPGKFYRQCVHYLSERLGSWGIRHRVVEVPYGKFPRFSVLGYWGEGRETLHFHGHYDVVPADSSSHFRAHIQGDRLYGRGSSDMKGGLVAVLFALRVLQESGMRPKGRITFSLVPDEETGGRLGTGHLLDSGLIPPVTLGMLMPEPTSGSIWNANKGALTYRIKIHGSPAHVGLASGVDNPFEHMVEIGHSLLKLKQDIQMRRTSMKAHPPQAKSSVMLMGGESGSGVSFNVIPEKAFFTIDRRLNPEESLDEAKKEIVKIMEKHKKRGIKMRIEILQEGESSLSEPESPLASALKESVLLVTGKTPDFQLCPGLCEIRFFNKCGVPAYAYGPGLLEVSHGPVEYVKTSDVLGCVEVYALTALRLLS
jgi:acetylornithine deacetylase/succinyl-diaminopimelate desuccinylase family protein